MTPIRESREVARLRAQSGGYFWLPCPLCDREFGGHEWRSVGGHVEFIPNNPGVDLTGTGICPDCTAAGAGCRAWVAVTPRRLNTACGPCVLPPEQRLAVRVPEDA